MSETIRLLIDSLQKKGVELSIEGGRLRYRPAELVTPDTLKVMRYRKTEIIAHLEHSTPGNGNTSGKSGSVTPILLPARPRIRAVRASRGLPTDLAALVQWFTAHRDKLPRKPYILRPGCRVTHPDQFHDSLAADVAAGLTSPRVRHGGLENDLTDLRRVDASNHSGAHRTNETETE
jgi:hypothetical protein